MKVLIADEQSHVREAVRQLADWDVLGIDTILAAEDGRNAIALIEKELPQIVVTSRRMPLNNDLDLLEWIQLRVLPCKIIVICEQDDFDIVQYTMQYGETDYLLKPLDGVQLQQALIRAAHSWRMEEKSKSQEHLRNMEMNQIKPIYRDTLLSTLLNQSSESETLRKQLTPELAGLFQTDACRIAVLSLDTLEHSLDEKFSNRRDLLFFTLINICNDFLEKRQVGVAFRYWNHPGEVILLFWDNLSQVESITAEISRGIFQTLNTRLDFGIGLSKSFPGGLQDSYKEARAALKKRNLLQSGSRIVVFQDYSTISLPHTLHLTDYEEHIRIAIRSGKLEQIEVAVNTWIDAVNQLDEITVEQLELWGHEYNVLKNRWMHDLFAEENSRLRLPSEDATYIVPMDSEGKLSIAMWHLELMESMRKLVKLLQNHQVQGSKVIYDIARYLDHHYAGDLTLQDLSDHFFLSREYISRKFKQQFGENVVDYISRIRIDKSKLLLLNPLLKIADIAQAVGYQDEKYFSKVFKKLEGVSPNEYRKTIKSLESIDSN
ncbi:MAG: hypothetical protein K0R67_2887 [Paenibacillus sp.]|nr:hypothetical protein [Paenibacillus sp.]